MAEPLPRQHRQSLDYPRDAGLSLPPLPAAVTTPTLLPMLGYLSLEPQNQPGDMSHSHPQTWYVHPAQSKTEPETWGAHPMGTSNTSRNGCILATPNPHWRPCQHPSLTQTLQRWLCSCFSPCCRCWGSWGVPGVSWNRSYLLPFIFQGCSAPWAELGESGPGLGPCSRRAPHGQRGMGHAQELVVVQGQGQDNPLMLVTMRFDGEQEFVLQSCRF